MNEVGGVSRSRGSFPGHHTEVMRPGHYLIQPLERQRTTARRSSFAHIGVFQRICFCFNEIPRKGRRRGKQARFLSSSMTEAHRHRNTAPVVGSVALIFLNFFEKEREKKGIPGACYQLLGNPRAASRICLDNCIHHYRWPEVKRERNTNTRVYSNKKNQRPDAPVTRVTLRPRPRPGPLPGSFEGAAWATCTYTHPGSQG